MLPEFRNERNLWKRQQAIAEKQLAPLFRKALRESVKPAIDFVRSMGTDVNPASMINQNVWGNTYLQAYNIIGVKLAKQEYYRQRGLEQQKANSIGFLIDAWTGTLRDFALTYVYQISRELNQTTIDIITRALGDTNALGLDRDGSIRLFEKALNGALRRRTQVISRTEATTIANLGKEVGARSWIQEQGGKGFKVWLGRNDARERPSHLDENNTIIEVDDKYNLSGELCERPGDVTLSAKERINCRCTQSIMSQNRYNEYIKRGSIVNGKLIGAS